MTSAAPLAVTVAGEPHERGAERGADSGRFGSGGHGLGCHRLGIFSLGLLLSLALTAKPTNALTATPTNDPTANPTATAKPTGLTALPTDASTALPTGAPTATPTPAPKTKTKSGDDLSDRNQKIISIISSAVLFFLAYTCCGRLLKIGRGPRSAAISAHDTMSAPSRTIVHSPLAATEPHHFRV